MTDPHDAFLFDNVTYSDATADRNLPSPAISISPVPVPLDSSAHRLSASSTNHPSTLSTTTTPFASTRDSDSQPAYATTNPSPDSHQAYDPYVLDAPLVTIHDTDSGQDVASTSTSANAPQPGNNGLVLAAFGSQPWTTPVPGPYLDFAPRPIYEPTGELLREQPASFDHFDGPVNIKPPIRSNSQSESYPTSDSPATTQDSKAVNVFAQPSLPRSALKRKADFVDSQVSEDSTTKNPKLGEGHPTKPRAVSFERMSGPGPTSPDEGSTPSDLQPGQSRNDNLAQRRSRQLSASTPRAAPAHGSGRSARGTRAPSGHPPSILPPEKVFPIQIGSELFRLSGASISSDGKHAVLSIPLKHCRF